MLIFGSKKTIPAPLVNVARSFRNRRLLCVLLMVLFWRSFVVLRHCGFKIEIIRRFESNLKSWSIFNQNQSVIVQLDVQIFWLDAHYFDFLKNPKGMFRYSIDYSNYT